MTTPTTKTNPALSIYLGNEFAAQVAEAARQYGFDPKELCKQVLQNAVTGKLPDSGTDSAALQQAQAQAAGYLDILTRSQQAWNKVAEQLTVDISLPGDQFTAAVLARIEEIRIKAAMVEQSGGQAAVANTFSAASVGVDYDLYWLNTEQELRSQFENLTTQGGKPISVATTVDGRFLLLAAWPAG